MFQDVVVVASHEDEINPFVRLVSKSRIMFSTWEPVLIGEIGDFRIRTFFTGNGKVNTAAVFAKAASVLRPDRHIYINIGSCTPLLDTLNQGDITACYGYEEVDFEFSEVRKVSPSILNRFDTLSKDFRLFDYGATLDSWDITEEDSQHLFRGGYSTWDSESAAFGRVAELFHVPYACFRVVNFLAKDSELPLALEREARLRAFDGLGVFLHDSLLKISESGGF